MKNTSWIGQTLSGRYKIEELLGQGGMSSVYKAMDPNLRRVVAIKMVHPHLSNDPSFMKRFEEEAAAIASLRHPNIVQVFDFNTDDDVNYMVMEFIPGETLQARLKRLNNQNKKMSVAEAIHITSGVCAGLNYAHKRGMVHRDIKPANIMLDINNQPVLMDFGIVKIVGSAAHTLTGAVVGTANYMAPEVIRSEPADQRSDIYSLGITLYEMLSGKPPFDADSAMTIMMMHLNDSLPNIEELRNDIPKELVTILEKSLAKNRNDRYQTAEDFANDLKRINENLPTQTFNKPNVKPTQGIQAEQIPVTQITPPEEMEAAQATLIQVPEKPQQEKEAPVTVIDQAWRDNLKPKVVEPKKPNKNLMTILIGVLVLVAVVIAGISTSWFGLVPKNEGNQPTKVIQETGSNLQVADATLAPAAATNAPPAVNVIKTEIPLVVNQEKLLICQVTDTGGIDDKSFNATAWLGMQTAASDFGVEVQYLESQQQSDYEVNLNAFVEAGCDLIVPVGFLLADATSAAADINPDQNYAIVDVDYLTQSNVLGNASKIDQATFLAGYLAAGMTKTGKVGTYVGILFPATQAFLDGYAMGVNKYNEVHGSNVQVLGWDMTTQKGLEVGNFESLDDGRAMGEQLLDEGADVIMPVAGPVGLGTLAVMQERGTGLLIGVDNDWSLANPDKADFVLASALKQINVFVYQAIKDTVNGNFSGGSTYLLTLENQGVGLAFGNNWDERIPMDLKNEILALIPGIISGEIPTLPTR